jgi:hypothetical protein
MTPGMPNHFHDLCLLGMGHGGENRQAENLFGDGMGHR